jgi:hypothetical protein
MVRINSSSLTKIALAMALTYGAYGWWSERPVTHGPGAVAPNPPRQESLHDGTPFSHKGYKIKPLAQFELEARVLSREDYQFDSSAKLSPVDLALGWGPMSDESVLAGIEISQSGRFYYWRTDQLPIPQKHIEVNSANMHLIPATSTVERRLKKVRPGQVVRFDGYLVEVEGPNNWHWRSSLTREDTGDGACEVVWIEHFSIIDRT